MKEIKLVVNKWQADNVPTVYAGGYSWYEALQLLWEAIEQVVTQVNEYFNEDLDNVVLKILNSWYDSGKIADLILQIDKNLDEKIAQFKKELAAEILKMQEQNMFVHVNDFGAKADGIADDSNAIINAFNFAKQKNKKYIVFNGKYAYGSTLNLSGFDDLTILGHNSVLTDLGRDVETVTGGYRKAPLGFKVSSVKSLLVKNLYFHNTAFTGYSGGKILRNATDNQAIFDIQSVEDLKLEGCKISGICPPYMYMDQDWDAGLYRLFSGAYISIYECGRVELKNFVVGGSTGKGELICIGNSRDLVVDGFTYIQTDSNIHPYSVFKAINLVTIDFKNLYVDYIGTGADFGDLSATKSITVSDSYFKSDKCDFIEITAEWNKYHAKTVPLVTFDNCYIESRFFNQYQMAALPEHDISIGNYMVKDCKIVSGFISGSPYSENITFENCDLYYKKYDDGSTFNGMRTNGNMLFSHCVFKADGMFNIFPYNNTRWLSDGRNSYVVFNDCDLNNVQFYNINELNQDLIHITVDGCRINFDSKYTSINGMFWLNYKLYEIIFTNNRISDTSSAPTSLIGVVKTGYIPANYIKIEGNRFWSSVGLQNGGVNLKVLDGAVGNCDIFIVDNHYGNAYTSLFSCWYSTTTARVRLFVRDNLLTASAHTIGMGGETSGTLEYLTAVYKDNYCTTPITEVRVRQLQEHAGFAEVSNNVVIP